MINHQLLLIWVKAEITDFYASNAKDAKCLPPVIGPASGSRYMA